MVHEKKKKRKTDRKKERATVGERLSRHREDRSHDDRSERRQGEGRKLFISQAGVIVCGRGHLQDALSILLHQRAPLHLPSQQQVLPIQRVDVLHLHRAVREPDGHSGRVTMVTSGDITGRAPPVLSDS